MQTFHKRNADRLHRQDAWKKSWYAFFPHQTYFGKLTGFSEDIVDGGQGFGMHPHQDMEIVTIPLYGAQRHQDSTGSSHVIDAGSVQVMSAGRGIHHSEVNASPAEPFRSFQIWVMPREKGLVPRHEVFRFTPGDKRNRVLTVLSPDRREGSALIHQNAFFSLSHLEAGHELAYALHAPGNGVYVHVANGEVTGEVTAGTQRLTAGDALALWETERISLKAGADADLIFVEVPVDAVRF
ncbi:MAG: pirin family protein [Cytophagales bacterium]|nr:pirin family protein [Cytophagales bacterium]